MCKDQASRKSYNFRCAFMSSLALLTLTLFLALSFLTYFWSSNFFPPVLTLSWVTEDDVAITKVKAKLLHHRRIVRRADNFLCLCRLLHHRWTARCLCHAIQLVDSSYIFARLSRFRDPHHLSSKVPSTAKVR